MKKINLGFKEFSDAALLVKSQAIKKAFTDNPNFQPTSPEFTAMVTASEEYAAALSAAKNGGRTQVAVKNQKKSVLVAALITLGNYVMLVAAGDVTILASSGFDVARDKTPNVPVGKPEIARINEGLNPGELFISLNRVRGAKMYWFEYTPDPLTETSQWIGQNTTLTSFTFKNLESSKRYWFRVAAMGNNQQMVYSDPVSRVVQ